MLTPNNDGRTPLHVAAFNNDRQAVEYLVINDADLTAEDINGDTPTMIASQHGHTDLAYHLELLELQHTITPENLQIPHNNIGPDNSGDSIAIPPHRRRPLDDSNHDPYNKNFLASTI